MVLFITYILLTGIVWLIFGQFWCLMKKRVRQRDALDATYGDRFQPKTAVILSLRGADPGLRLTLEGLCQLKFQNYELFVILDHPEDPAAKIVQNLIQDFPNRQIHLEFLQKPLETCSLKCSALIQILSDLDDSFSFAAFIDGDTIPFPEWLDELIRPFSDAKVDFVTGYRWFIPQDGGFGSLMRYFWNMASFVQMFLLHVCWGGSFAVRLQSARAFGMSQMLAHALVEDTSSAKLNALNLGRLEFAPMALMPCRERCSIMFAHRWCARQMLWVRLYLPGIWRLILLTIAILTIITIFTAVSIIASVSTVSDLSGWNLSRLTLLLVGPILFWGSIVLLFPLAEFAVQRNLRRFQSNVSWFRSRLLLKIPIAIFCAVFSFFLGIFQTLQTRRVIWRGISYQIHKNTDASAWPRFRIERLNYAPFCPTSKEKADSPTESPKRTVPDSGESIL